MDYEGTVSSNREMKWKQCADAALDDLAQAGLPASGEVHIMSVAEVWLPPPDRRLTKFMRRRDTLGLRPSCSGISQSNVRRQRMQSPQPR
jgi:hypothetical protein